MEVGLLPDPVSATFEPVNDCVGVTWDAEDAEDARDAVLVMGKP